MNKFKKCLYIASLLKSKGSLNHEEIINSLTARFAGESPLSESTLQRYFRSIEEMLACIIEYDRSTRMYSIRFPQNLPKETKDLVDRLLEKESIEETCSPKFLFNPETMMFSAIYKGNGKVETCQFLASTMEEGLEKAQTFFKDHLEWLGVVSKKCKEDVKMKDIKIIWAKGFPNIVNTNLEFNYKQLFNDLSEKQRLLTKKIVSGDIDLKSELNQVLKLKEVSNIAEMCKDRNQYELILQMFKLGVIANYPYKTSEYSIIYKLKTNSQKLFEFYVDTLDKFGNQNDNDMKLMLLSMAEKDEMLLIFACGMILATKIDDNDLK